MDHFKKEMVERQVLQGITCDRCKKYIPKEDEFEYQEMYPIYFYTGYGSVFGNQRELECTLCQSCLKELVGEYLVDVVDDNIEESD